MSDHSAFYESKKKPVNFVKALVLVSAILLVSCAVSNTNTQFADMLSLAEKGNPEAQYLVGMMYNNGKYVDKDPKKAFVWFENSAAGGDPLGAFKLGCYYAGQFHVVPVDLDKALKYYMIAAQSGYSLAQNSIASIYYTQHKYKKALRWLERSAKQGYFESLYALGFFYREGNIVPKDKALAYAYFKLAKLNSNNHSDRDTQADMEKLAPELTPSELARAEHMVSFWKSQATPITKRVSAGYKLTNTSHTAVDK